MFYRSDGPQYVVLSLLATLGLWPTGVFAVPQARTSNGANSPTIQFVYFKAAKIPLAADAPTHKNIYSVSSKSTEEKQLTNDGHSFGPVISPDGTKVAYIHVTSDTCEDCLVPPKYEINVMNSDGTNPRTLVSVDWPVQLFWSPDQKTVVYGGAASVISGPSALPDSEAIRRVAAIDSSPYSLYQIDSDGNGPARLLASNAIGFFNQVEWSADAMWIAYNCQSQQKVNRPALHICLIATGQQAESRLLTEDVLSVGRYSWSPDGNEVLYSMFDPQADKLHKDAYRLFVGRVDGSAPRLLTTSKDGGTPHWSPDGKKILFCDQEKKKSVISVINADGSGKVRLTDPKLNASEPIWSDDGKEIAFSAPVHGKLQVHLVNFDGSQLQILTHDTKLSCSSVTWLRNTRLLLLRCGQTVSPWDGKFGSYIDGGYYLNSVDNTVGAPVQLTRQDAMALSFAPE